MIYPQSTSVRLSHSFSYILRPTYVKYFGVKVYLVRQHALSLFLLYEGFDKVFSLCQIGSVQTIAEPI